jgi:hypothetical protein
MSASYEQVKEWIEGALEYSHGTHDFADIVKAIKEQKMQIWINDDAVAVTEIIDYPKKRMLHVFLAGGSMQGVRSLEDSAVKWAKDIGCSAFTLTGRKGWEKALKNSGWQVSHSMMIKEI